MAEHERRPAGPWPGGGSVGCRGSAHAADDKGTAGGGGAYHPGVPGPYELRDHADPEAFSAVAEPFLLQRETAHCLPLGLLPALRAGLAPGAFMATVHEPGGACVAAALMTPPHRLIISECAAGHEAAAVLAPLADAVPGAPGVLGPMGEAHAFALGWSRKHGRRARWLRAERVHECVAVLEDGEVARRVVAGEMRRAERAELPLLVAWLVAFRREASPDDPRTEPSAAVTAVERDLEGEEGGLWLWCVEGRPVSMAGARGPTRNGIRVGPVYTPPGLRGHGYAGALTLALTRELLRGGRRRVTLFTVLANPTPNRLYQAIGYRPVADQDLYDFGGG